MHNTKILSQEYSITYRTDNRCSYVSRITTLSYECLSAESVWWHLYILIIFYILLSHRKCQILSTVHIRDLNKQEAYNIQPSFIQSFVCDSFIQKRFRGEASLQTKSSHSFIFEQTILVDKHVTSSSLHIYSGLFVFSIYVWVPKKQCVMM